MSKPSKSQTDNAGKDSTKDTLIIMPATLTKSSGRYCVYAPSEYNNRDDIATYRKEVLEKENLELAVVLIKVPKGHVNMAIEDSIRTLLSGKA